jgi:predicted nucleotide-binding protein (sugar kinase/HSP70/actin superfamily)
VISFPHLANYYIPIQFLLRALLPGWTVRPAPPITANTLALGSRHSPDFACVPFKYNLGNFIEALEAGANVLLQTCGGCRLGYYAEVQEQILRDLGYSFTLVYLRGSDFGPLGLVRLCRRLGVRRQPLGAAHAFGLAFRMGAVLDAWEGALRERLAYAKAPEALEALHGEFLRDLEAVTTFRRLEAVYGRYKAALADAPLWGPENFLRVGLVGELYSLMEPFCNFQMEKELARQGVALKRFTTASYLLFQKKWLEGPMVRRARPYLKYSLGADGTDSVANAKMLAEQGYDGIIHLKPFGCTPEVNAVPILQRISAAYKIPVLFLSFDAQTSETGIRTRLEAFRDMLAMRKGRI